MSAAGSSSLSRLVLGALVLAPVALMAWSWGQWADPQVDFGRELYAAWRLTEGDHLYRDIAWFNGPLSPYWNAAWLGTFGVSLRTLAFVNLGLVYVALVLLLSLVRRWSSPVAAWVAGFVFLGTSAFGQNVGVGNYNFIAPYSHGIVHGLLLGLGALAALQRLGRGKHVGWAAVAGLCVGLAFLTKAEVFLAAAGASAVRLGLHVAQTGAAGARARTLLCFALGALLPIALAYTSLAAVLPAGSAGRSLLGSWAYVGEDALTESIYYRRMAGFDRVGTNLLLLVQWGAGIAALLGAATWLARRLPPGWDGNLLARWVALALGVGLGGALLTQIEWRQLPRPYPVVVGSTAVLVLRRWRSLRAQPLRAAPAADQLAFSVLAGLLLVKMLLNVRLEHYGFCLALPATALLVALAVDSLPRIAARGGGAGRVLRATSIGLLVAFVGVRMRSSNAWFQSKDETVGRGPDAIRAGWRGPALSRALTDLEQRLGPDDTLLVVPEGVMLNYLLRRRNPTPFINFMPPELIFWGERPVVYALEAQPPDVVVLVHKDTLDDYGKDWFGSRGFGEEIMAWVRERYRVDATYGREPHTEPFHFGVQIWVPKER